MEHLGIFTSNHLFPLVEHLAARLERDPLPPLDDETIVVQSHGMARWLQLELARRHGIAASLHLPFPGSWARELARTIGLEPAPTSGAPDPFDPTSLTWRLHERFATVGEDAEPELEPVRTYLAADTDGRKRYQLATRVAGCFAGYQLHRPEMLREWEEASSNAERASNERWQARLWRELVEEADSARPLSSILLELRERLARGSIEPDLLPRRVTVFGVPTLAPILVEILGALATHVKVGIYVVTPTREYWSDVISEPQLEMWRLREGVDADPELEHLDIAHPLLGSMGVQGRDLGTLLQEIDRSGQAHEALALREPDGRSVLGRVQADILALVDPDARPEAEKPELDPKDRSLRLHVCHSPMREMETLREELLRAFDEGVIEEPGQVLVLVPDVSEYAPYIRAVFGPPVLQEDGRELRIPHRLADRHPADEQPFARVLLQLLGSAEGRRTASEILDLVEQESVARRFGLEAESLPALRDRVRQAGIHWGVDPDRRGRDQAIPSFAGGTWREGLDRLLIGIATGPVEARVSGIVPVSDVTTGRAALVAGLADAVDALTLHLDTLRGPHDLAGWIVRARRALLALTLPADEQQEMERRDVLTALDGLASQAPVHAPTASVGRAAFVEALRTALGDRAAGRGFITGSVTFAELRPMRSLPFDVIAVAGLDEGGFPRPDRPLGFDLVAASRRRGDRNPRDDDRYLFLETLLAAGRRLILSTVGRSQQDNAELARSSCVDELMDTIDRTFRAPAGRSASEVLTIEHRLQPFHAAYADPDDDDRFTYDAARVRAIAAARGGSQPRPRFVTERFERSEDEIPRDEDGRELVALEHLLAFWAKPMAWFCRQRLGLALRFDEALDLDTESFAVDALARWRASEWLLARRAMMQEAGAQERDLLPVVTGLPPGRPGEVHARALQRETNARWEHARAGAADLPPLTVDLRGRDWRLQGRLTPCTSDGLLVVVAAKAGTKRRLDVWIRHLALAATAEAQRTDVPVRSRLVGRDVSYRYDEVADPLQCLARLIEGWRAGQEAPLCFFPETSAAYEVERRKTEDQQASHEFLRRSYKVTQAWEGRRGGSPGEREDEAVRLCTRGRDEVEVLGEDFRHWASEVFGPLLDAERKG